MVCLWWEKSITVSSARQQYRRLSLLQFPEKSAQRTLFVLLWVLLTVSFLKGCASSSKDLVPDTLGVGAPNRNAPYNKSYTVRGKTYYPMRSAVGYNEQGIASWYGSESGNRTAMGTRFNPHGLTAAHKTLPLPTRVRVTSLKNGRSVDVVVNDRGPFKKNRLIDLSHGAAKRIGLDKQGLVKVKVESIETQSNYP